MDSSSDPPLPRSNPTSKSSKRRYKAISEAPTRLSARESASPPVFLLEISDYQKMVKTGVKKENNGEKNEKSQASQILDGFLKEEEKMKMCNGLLNKLIVWLIITGGLAFWSLFAIFLQENIDVLLIIMIIYQLLIILFYYYRKKKTQKKKKKEREEQREERRREIGRRQEEGDINRRENGQKQRREDNRKQGFAREGEEEEEERVRKEKGIRNAEKKEEKKEERGRKEGRGRNEMEGRRRNEEEQRKEEEEEEEEEEEDNEEGWGDRLLPSLEMATIVVTTLMVRLRAIFAFKSLGLLVIPYFLIYVIFWSLLFGNRFSMKLMASLLLRLYGLVQCLQLLFKLEAKIEWDWEMVFWPTWTLIGIFGAYTFGLSIIICITTGQSKTKKIDNFKIQGLIFTLLLCSLILVSIIFASLGLIEFCEFRESTLLLFAIFYFLIFSTVILLFIKKFDTNIRKYILSILYESELIHQLAKLNPVVLTTDPSLKTLNTAKGGIKILESLSEDIPKMLFKFSSTFYKAVEHNGPNPRLARTEPRIDTVHMTEEQKETKTNTESCCVICLEREANGVIVKCGHGGVCWECGVDLLKRKGNCLLCRQPIEKILKIKVASKSKNKKLSSVVAVADFH